MSNFILKKDLTNDGAVPTSSHGLPLVDLDSISHTKQRIKDGLATRRPWKVMFDFHYMGVPQGLSDAFSRIKTNLAYFRSNYAIVVLNVIFFSLIWHPTSLFLFAGLLLLWIFLYFFRDEPLKLFRFQIDDRVVLIVLSVITVACLLLFTDATFNIVAALMAGAVLVLIHAVVRRTEDLFLDEEATTTTT
ncbi:PREDICTED: PRA1 family protein F3-like [Camelina sativa]|uniref:PRA1 family protein n=1 Tax=Camelina sativa TaxID=90675 RepID=A0ABM0W3M7_CAMSA|nr:PREDICTED: PRA1 family protein F3-like [Camelina sativa]